jgi:DNA end-binding protein Ku
MRSIWKGTISFGLVTIPVKLYTATEQRDIAFHQVHRADGGQIKFKRVCSVCGEEVSYADVAKGYPLPTGETVVLTEDDLAGLPLVSGRAIEVLQFTPAEQIDPIFLAKSYYLEPETVGARPYVLLRTALERSGRVAIAKIALRQRESLALLRVRDGVFVLETMLWPDEVRTASFPFLDEDIGVRAQELRMAVSLIDTMTADFDAAQYHDDYREALEQLIEAKITGHEVVRPADGPGEPVPAQDLVAALRASVEAAKARADETPSADGSSGRRRARRKRGDVTAAGGRR